MAGQLPVLLARRPMPEFGDAGHVQKLPVLLGERQPDLCRVSLVSMTNTASLPKKLTPEQLQQFREEGYVMVPGFFHEGEVTAMQAELERLQEEGLLRNVSTEGDGKTTSKAKANLQICPLSPKSSFFQALPFCEKVRDAVEDLIGPEFFLRLDQIFLKPPRHGAGTNWHQDNAYFKSPDPLQGVGMWVALHDAKVENGTMHVVPRAYDRQLHHRRDEGSDHHIRCDIDEEIDEIVPVEMAAGGALFFNYGVPHCTKANDTDKPRAGLALHFLNSRYRSEPAEGAPARPCLSGRGFTGGEAEYGENLTGVWEAQVRA